MQQEATRIRVFKAIASERDYQDALWGPKQHSLTEWLAYIRDYVEEALHAASLESDHHLNQTMKLQHALRKIAAMSVAAMEQHGAPQRVVKDMCQHKREHHVPDPNCG